MIRNRKVFSSLGEVYLVEEFISEDVCMHHGGVLVAGVGSAY